MSDCDSVGSAGSAATVKRDCPVCHKEFTARSLFKHIRMKHDAHWFEGMYANEKMLDAYIEKCEPIPFFYMEKNDFDEEETKDIYGCLACNNTFTHKGHGTTHCNKAKCKATHIKETKALKDRVKDMKTRMDNRKESETWNREKFCTEIEKLMRWCKYMKNGTMYQTLLTAYNERRVRSIASTERALSDKRNEVFNVNQNNLFSPLHYPIINPIADYNFSYNKEALDMFFIYNYWRGIASTIEITFVYMREHYDYDYNDPTMFLSMKEEEPARQYICISSIDEYLHKLPAL